MNQPADKVQIEAFLKTTEALRAEIAREIVGQKGVIDHLLIALVAGGNVLLEGVPGLGKTRLVRALSRAVGLTFSRIQFTPDLMPADITGTNIVMKTEQGSAFQFEPGPLFAQIVLADEINRATPKTQSALLEAMQEHSVTVAGQTRALAEPYFVLATQNPVEQEGTYPLPEAQLDRFLFKVLVPFPTLEELSGIVDMTVTQAPSEARTVASGQDILAMRAVARQVPVARAVTERALKLVMNTHPELEGSPEYVRKDARFGASPRAAQALIAAARVRALMEGRYNASMDDIDRLAAPCLRHRVALGFEGLADGETVEKLIERLIGETK
ncbi:MAG: AAA family ATPase [Christensenellaceae bacterium]|nr:AAA family ATPase [Christensenellaceae bacterium]